MKTIVNFVIGFALLTVTGLAAAALPAGISSGLSTVQSDGLALIDLIWPVVLALFGGMVLFKLFKRAGSKI